MTLRIRLDELSEKVRECLERGERVEIERNGEIVGRLEPEGEARRTGWSAFIELRRKHGPVDEAFETDLEEIRETLNAPAGSTPWES